MNLLMLFLPVVMFSPLRENMSDYERLDFSRQHPIVLDIKKDYPKKKVVLEDIAEVSYIPLETSSNILMDKDGSLAYISEKKIVIFNRHRGDVFIFGHDGKALFYFNHQEKNGYRSIISLAYDEKNKEVFINDYRSKKILVYSEAGIFKRTLYFPPDTRFKEFYHYDDQTLLAINEDDNWDQNNINHRKPYIFLSKKDGKIVSRLNITISKNVPRSLSIETKPNEIRMITITVGGNCKFGEDFVIANRSADTVYLLTPGKKLLPMIVRTPSVHATKSVLTVGLKTDRFIILSLTYFDVEKAKITSDMGQKWDPKSIGLIYDYNTGQFFEYEGRKLDVRLIDIAKNMSASLIPAEYLVEALKKGKLEGNAKQVAQKLNEEDNPVLKLIRFK